MELSTLRKTWIFDLDGTLVKHNGYLIDGKDTLLDGVQNFFNEINPKDIVIIITSREEKYKEITKTFLDENNIHYDYIIFDAPVGERILVNDKKPSGLRMSYSINCDRNKFPTIIYNEVL